MGLGEGMDGCGQAAAAAGEHAPSPPRPRGTRLPHPLPSPDPAALPPPPPPPSNTCVSGARRVDHVESGAPATASVVVIVRGDQQGGPKGADVPVKIEGVNVAAVVGGRAWAGRWEGGGKGAGGRAGPGSTRRRAATPRRLAWPRARTGCCPGGGCRTGCEGLGGKRVVGAGDWRARACGACPAHPHSSRPQPDSQPQLALLVLHRLGLGPAGHDTAISSDARGRDARVRGHGVGAGVGSGLQHLGDKRVLHALGGCWLGRGRAGDAADGAWHRAHPSGRTLPHTRAPAPRRPCT